MNGKILMIEDERGLLLSVGDRMAAEGYEFRGHERGDSGLELALNQPWDLFLVDVMLPGLDGFELVRTLRRQGIVTPVLFVTARDQIVDRVSGLRLGADDYVVKPFAMDELVARVETCLRRKNAPGVPPQPTTTEPRWTFGPFVFDPVQAGVFKGEERLPLTHQEYRLLQVLLEAEGKVLDANTLLNLAWGYSSNVTSRTLYVHMSWLRQKLVDKDHPDGFIQTVRGFGYAFSGGLRSQG